MRDDNDIAKPLKLAIWAVSLFVVGMSLAFLCERPALAIVQDAVEHGKAEYYLDEHGRKQWRWTP